LTSRGRKADQQKQFSVHYRGRYIGKLIPDLIVDDAVIVDTKVVEQFAESHLAQVLGYLKISKLQLGLLLNFKYASLDWKRIVRTTAADSQEPIKTDYSQPKTIFSTY
jgi:GxxExxY protein